MNLKELERIEKLAQTKRWVLVLSCEGQQGAYVYNDKESALKTAAEYLFGIDDVPQEGSEHYQEWQTIHEELVQCGFMAFEDGSVSLIKTHADKTTLKLIASLKEAYNVLKNCSIPSTWHAPCRSCGPKIIEAGNYAARQAVQDIEKEFGG